jgi:protein-tyrosine-phosphatase
MAEAVFQAQVKQRNPDIQGKIVKIDSCGTGAYHVGDDPDERTVQTCKKVSREKRPYETRGRYPIERLDTVADEEDGSWGGYFSTRSR